MRHTVIPNLAERRRDNTTTVTHSRCEERPDPDAELSAIPNLAERRGALLHGLLRALLLVLELRLELGQLGALIVTVVLRRAPRVARARLLVLGGLQRRCLVLELGLPRPLEVVERVGVASLTVTRSC